MKKCILLGLLTCPKTASLSPLPSPLLSLQSLFSPLSSLQVGLSLRAVEYIVFDEADRLFEMGFAPQIQEIIQNLPEKRCILISLSLSRILYYHYHTHARTLHGLFTFKSFLPFSRQTVLVSATMPSLLVEFARAGSVALSLSLSLSLSLPPSLPSSPLSSV